MKRNELVYNKYSLVLDKTELFKHTKHTITRKKKKDDT